MSKNTRNRILLTALAALLLVTLTIGGTLAWLVDSTTEVKNTFEATGIDIELDETKQSDGTDLGDEQWEMDMIPGTTGTKNPVVSVVRANTDVDIWLFVRFNETVDETYLKYTNTLETDADWTQGTGTDGIPTDVWYTRVDANESKACSLTTACGVTDPHWHLLAGDTVTVDTETNGTTVPGGEMKWIAYAIQVKNGNNTEFTAATAWDELDVQ